MIPLDQHDAALTNLNTRIERHGDERVLTVDMKFNTKANNSILDSFGNGLRESLFRKPGKGEQPDLPTIGDALSAVRHPYLEPMKLSHEFTGYEVQINGLLDSTNPLLFVDVKLKKFTIAPLEGGSVELTFTASTNVEPEELSALSDALIREGVRLTLTPPSKQEEQAPLRDAA